MVKEESGFFPSSIKKVIKTPGKSIIHKCRECGNNYASKHHESIKSKGLIRNQRKSLYMAKAVNGTLYVIGSDTLNTPYKIGIVSGYDIRQRKSSIQTGNWIELKIIWKSDIIERVDIIEKKLHDYFVDKHVRGEWFNISKKDIDNLPSIINQLK
jgi:uncharacterized Zn finger protein